MSAHARPYPATVSASPVSRTVPTRPGSELARLRFEVEAQRLVIDMTKATLILCPEVLER